MRTAGSVRRGVVSLLSAAVATAAVGGGVAAATHEARVRQAARAPDSVPGSTVPPAGGNAIPRDDLDLPPRIGPIGDPLPDAPFAIDLPAGWSGGEMVPTDYDAARSWRFTDSDGRFFVVNIDPAGSDFSADAVWRVRVDDDRLTIVDRGTRCAAGEGLCGAGDGRLDLWALWIENGSAPMRGHAYYFHFGSERDENADDEVFAEILRSLRAR